MRVRHVYSDDAGRSHQRLVTLRTERTSTGGTDISEMTPVLPVRGVLLRDVLQSDEHIEPHTPPRRQFVLQLRGSAEIITSDGEVGVIAQGDVLFVEDISGEGHRFKPVQDPRATVFLPVADDFSLADHMLDPPA